MSVFFLFDISTKIVKFFLAFENILQLHSGDEKLHGQHVLRSNILNIQR